MPTAATTKLTSVAEVAGTLKQVEQAFTALQVARNQFINTLSTFLARPDSDNVLLEALMQRDCLAVLCCPLVSDPVPGVQAGALECLAKLAERDPILSQSVVSSGVLDSVVHSVTHESPPVQAAADRVLAAVAGSTTDFARRVIEAGALPNVLSQLQRSPPPVKEAAVACLNSIIGSHVDHARLICDDHFLGSLVALLRTESSPHKLCKAVVSTLGATASYSPELAEAVIRSMALPPVCLLVRAATTPPDLRSAAITCLAHVASHNEALAEEVVARDPQITSSAVGHMADKMVPAMRRAAAALLLQVARKTPRLAQQVCDAGAPATLCKYLQMESAGQACLAGVTLAGTLASYDATSAKAVIDAGVSQLVVGVLQRSEPTARGAAAWAIEQMAQHEEETAGPLVGQGALMACLDLYTAPASALMAAAAGDIGRVGKSGTVGMGGAGGLGDTAGSSGGDDMSSNGSTALLPGAGRGDDVDMLRAKLKAAIKALLRKCNAMPPLEALIADTTPPEVLEHVLARAQPLLWRDAKARQAFVTCGALMRLQHVEVLVSGMTKAKESVAAINALFPEDVVAYYRNGK